MFHVLISILVAMELNSCLFLNLLMDYITASTCCLAAFIGWFLIVT